MNNLGSLYYNGCSVEQDYARVKYYYELAVEQNNARAMNNLGLLYYYGYGVEQDRIKAICWVNRSVENNYNDAIRNLSTLIGNINIGQLKPNLYYKLSSDISKQNLLNRFYKESMKIRYKPILWFQYYRKNTVTPYDPQYISIFVDGIKRGIFDKDTLNEEKLLEAYKKYQLSTYKKIMNKFNKNVPLHIASLITDFL